ncbi:hypothetical protein [Butyrivibrio sp. AE2032]|uniref:hypothetical protein n=1 Tax=Butyrivibrio sp. AE2032 TaxID=1458463 RepID=UPI000553DCA0|nr:hypothetical protein [Butyrivibrio sp. AE2032]
MVIRKIIAAAMTAGMMMTFIPATAMAAGTGWQGSNAAGWRYYTSDTEYVKNSWKKIGGKWYHFDKSGFMQTGWIEDGGIWYYLDKTGAMLVDSWETINGKMYHFGTSGAMDTNKWISYSDIELIDISGVDVVFHKDFKNSKMWRYVGSNGAAYVGWKVVDGRWYYFDEEIDTDNNTGDILNGILLYENEDRYGAMRYGWLTDNKGSVYFFDGRGRYKNDGWFNLVLSEGSDAWFYFQPDGRAYIGWHQIDGSWYYFVPGVGSMYQNGSYRIDNKYYYFKENGQMITGWYKDKSGRWYLARDNGALYAYEWYEEDGKWYYFGSIGAMTCNKNNYYINGKYYDFDSHGVCKNPYSGRTTLT